MNFQFTNKEKSRTELGGLMSMDGVALTQKQLIQKCHIKKNAWLSFYKSFSAVHKFLFWIWISKSKKKKN